MSPPIGSAEWIDAELRARLGEGATIGSVTFEGKLCVITGARVPLGGAVVAIARAEIELGKGAPIGSFPLSARLVSMRGELSMESIALVVPIELEAGDREATRWFLGKVRARDARVGEARFQADLTLDVGPEGARLTGRVEVHEAPIFEGVTMSATPGLEVDLASHGALESLSIRGRAFAQRIAIARRNAPDSSLRLDDVAVVVDVDRRRLRYSELSARAHGARISGWGRVPIQAPSIEAASVPLAALGFDRAGGGLFASIAALFGVTVRASRSPIDDREVHAIPADLTASGEIVVLRDRTTSAAVLLSTARSELRLRIAPTTGSLEGSTLRGRLAVDDGIVIGIFSSPVRPRAETILDVDARLTGSLRAPGLTGRVSARRLWLDISRDPAHPSFLLESVSTLLDVSASVFAWHRFSARVYGGTFVSSGRVDRGLDATVSIAGVRIESLPTQAEGESRIASQVEGALSAEIAFTRHAIEGATVGASGRIALSEPRYLFVRALAPDLARFGLPKIRSRGRGPLTARLSLVRDQLTIEDITAALEGVEATGNMRMRLDGRLDGALTVNVLSSYLSQSPLLAVPAALAGRLTIPIAVGGSVRAPKIHTDAWAILEALVVDNKVGDAVKSVMDSLGEWGRKRR